jgi:carboxymethylenebutenolidase
MLAVPGHERSAQTASPVSHKEESQMCDLDNCNPRAGGKPRVSAQDRRLFLAGALALPLATILADIDLARAEAAKGVTLSQTTADGRTVSAYFAEAEAKDAPVVILIHEWWGLNDNIKAMAEDIRGKGFHALAIDLFNGSVATDSKQARAQTKGVKADEAAATIAAWVAWGKANGNGRVATLGWCFGGGWSLSAALANQLDAAVIYYGRVTASAKSLATLSVPLLGHFGTLDKSINPEMVGAFQKRLRDVGKEQMLTTHWYTAGHAFANPTGGRYDEDVAAFAWARTHTFLASHLR